MSEHVIKEIFSWLAHILLAVFFAFVLVFFIGMRTSVIGVSMENTLYSGQQVLVNRLSYLIFKPDVGDIIVFTPNGSRNTHFYVKRVVAVPGDIVCIKDGKLYVNNTIVDYGYDKIMDAGIAENEIGLIVTLNCAKIYDANGKSARTPIVFMANVFRDDGIFCYKEAVSPKEAPLFGEEYTITLRMKIKVYSDMQRYFYVMIPEYMVAYI